MRLDLHIHTCYSYDSLLSLDAVEKVVMRKGLYGVAVLDHDEIDGALHLREQASFHVIVGEEIGTQHGGIGGLFLHKRIPPHLSAEETANRIHAQGGLVFIPHPLARGVPGRIQERELLKIINRVDLIEGYNARAPLPADDRRARQLAVQHGLPVAAGSDGHFACEIGRAWTEMDAFRGAEQFLASLRRGSLHYGTKIPYLVAALTVAMIAPLTALRSLREATSRRKPSL